MRCEREATAFRPVKPPSLARSTPPSPRGAPRPDDRRPTTEDRRPPPPSHLHDPPIVPSVVVRCSVRTEADRILTISNFNPTAALYRTQSVRYSVLCSVPTTPTTSLPSRRNSTRASERFIWKSSRFLSLPEPVPPAAAVVSTRTENDDDDHGFFSAIRFLNQTVTA